MVKVIKSFIRVLVIKQIIDNGDAINLVGIDRDVGARIGLVILGFFDDVLAQDIDDADLVHKGHGLIEVAVSNGAGGHVGPLFILHGQKEIRVVGFDLFINRHAGKIRNRGGV